MTIANDVTYSGPYLGNGTTDTYAFSFNVNSTSEVIVYELNTATNTLSELSHGSGITITLAGDGTGTAQRMAGVLPSGVTWIIRPSRNMLQPTSFTSQTSFYPELHETQMDDIVLMIQQLKDDIDRSVKINPGDADYVAKTMQLPLLVNMLGKYFSVDASGDIVGSTGTGADAGLRTDLAASSGSSLVGYDLGLAHTIPRSVSSRLTDNPCLFDWMSAGEQNDVINRTGLVSVATAINNALSDVQTRGRKIYAPSGLYTVDTTLAYPAGGNSVHLVGEVATGPTFNGTEFIWAGSASGTLMDTTGARDWGLMNVALNGDNIAGLLLKIQRNAASGEFNTGAIVDNVYAYYADTGIQFSSAGGAQYQAFDEHLRKIQVIDCTTGIEVNNSNDLVLNFFGLSFKTYTGATKQMVNGLLMTNGGRVNVDDMWANNQITDYVLKSDGNGQVHLNGGYSESTMLMQIANPASPVTVGPSVIANYDHYPTNAAGPGQYGVDYDRASQKLNIKASRIGNGVHEGTNSGGIFADGSDIDSWTGRTTNSMQIGGLDINDRTQNVTGKGMYQWSNGDNIAAVGENVYWDGTYYRIVNAGTATIWLTSSGVTTCYEINGAAAGSAHAIGDFTTLFSLDGTSITSGNTTMTLGYHNGSVVTTGKITLGAADSGGVGYKLLRVPN